MMYIESILKTHYDNDLLAMFVEYDTVYRRHRQIVKQARKLNRQHPPQPISIDLMGEGIASRADIVKKTQEMMETITTLSVITESLHWRIKHVLKKYNGGWMNENDQVKLCSSLSAELKSLPTIQNIKKENEDEKNLL